jgi:hypothetical protein
MRIEETLVADDETLLRRALPKDNCIGRDPLTNRYYPLPGALTIDKDGMSVYRQMLLEERAMLPSAVCKRADHWVFSFRASSPRRVGWNVLHVIDEDDPDIGFAHSLVLTSTMPPTKKDKLLLRNELAENSELVVRPIDSADDSDAS